MLPEAMDKGSLMRYFPCFERFYRSFNANITWCDLPEDVSLWPGLPLS